MPLLHTSLLYNIFCQESSAFSIFRLVFQKSLASCGKIIRNVSGLLKKIQRSFKQIQKMIAFSPKSDYNKKDIASQKK